MEIDLLAKYPKTKRDLSQRSQTRTAEDIATARKFGFDFFDGDRRVGYGGYNYHPRFWSEVVKDFRDRYGLTKDSRILDVGCGKGFMLHDFGILIPGVFTAGIDISTYAILHAMEDMQPYVLTADSRSIPHDDKSFDLVISINTIHNLDRDGCIQSLREIMRVSRKNAFITVDAYRNAEEKERMFAWNLTAKTILHVDEWRALFQESGYTGDYYWFTP